MKNDQLDIFIQENILGAKPVYEYVNGSPYQVNDRVKIIGFSDETGDDEFIGKTGVVQYLEYSCGCGQSYPNDPMIAVMIDNKSVIECWAEEITYA